MGESPIVSEQEESPALTQPDPPKKRNRKPVPKVVRAKAYQVGFLAPSGPQSARRVRIDDVIHVEQGFLDENLHWLEPVSVEVEVIGKGGKKVLRDVI